MKKNPYLGLKVWKWLCGHPWSKAGEVANGLGWSQKMASQALYTLKAGHNARYEGKGARGVWCATEIPPRDGRGLALGSARGRAKGPLNLPKANARLAELSAAGKLRRNRKPRPSVFDGKIALEQCWTGISLKALQASSANDNDNKGRRGPKALELPESEEKAA